ncbi:WLM domain-containing protein [Microdochium trichocladiopsis]|uniref:WLM domain-containing protein n=1 Tax=Microdochium trichocladiopsis TaxID=1682393 RepID=A0A9P9BNG5_9PEZI|nr:WLM domain-containing protein [Microdochium trichocladiopsis]KAH7027701.1 WLM domain-containing protein [Microdochium trichocladiopsis]
MPEVDPLILSYSHLADFPRASDALHTLKKIASLVKPLMRARGWTVRQLTEFYPNQENLLGLNVNRGQKICLRLRYPSDRSLFLPLEQVVDTMLHELAHNVHGPHDGKFHALWDQLRDEHEALAMKGYTGEGFLSQGHRLGGSARLPMDEARRLARASAEQRRRQQQQHGQHPAGGGYGGRRLGGSAARPDRDIRSTIADAAARRNNRISRGCANDKQSADEIRAIADTATRNGFRTQAEEDAANEAAIAQALWELVQEDEKARLGDAYVPPTAYIPQDGESPTSMSRDATHPTRQSSSTLREGARTGTRTAAGTNNDQKAASNSSKWSCAVCTLENPAIYLCCDACGTERRVANSRNDDDDPAGTTAPATTTATDNSNHAKRKRTETIIDLTSPGGVLRRGRNDNAATKSLSSTLSATPIGGGPARVTHATQASSAPHPKSSPATWTCSFCGRVRERQWWSCDLCGKVKDSSA